MYDARVRVMYSVRSHDMQRQCNYTKKNELELSPADCDGHYLRMPFYD
jgi:hypothetical protein